ncbi:sensor histidine kinase [Saccharothrix violaceirubra]|uniref:histidine kinase n=1 Tax=Saccharothrix violaceirubra TaxID=413306 RepID=A0A7W7T3P6_9PSEU|nr:histidine kinase [Saccharothrix violaceirubra]MBB4965726.1 signal transduction histidine kinase [Saccharothrix violaceirubra]
MIVLSVAVCLPLLGVRRFPLTAALLCAAVALVGTGVDAAWPGRLVAVAAFCVAAYHRPRTVPVLVGAVAWTFLFATTGSGGGGRTAPVTDLVIMGVAPVAVGYGIRAQRERAAHQARLAVAEDRARLARDMHDSVGHHLTAIRLQAAAGRRVPAAGDKALATISDLSAAALAEVRGLVDALRAEPDVEALATRLSGPDLRITTRGTTSGLPEAVGDTAFRIVQEALTNVVRHSDADRVEVELRRRRGVLVVTVSDNGSARGGVVEGGVVEGNGLRGIRERVAALAGTVHIGWSDGWRVDARLPVRR